MWRNGFRMGDCDLAAFYREQALRIARYALTVKNEASRFELLEMAASFQRLAQKEDSLLVANANIPSSEEKTG